MKKAVTYLFIVFLATLIFYGGAGVNLITYCCGDCRTEGAAVLLDDKCCEIHGHDHSGVETNLLMPTPEADDCCDVERVNFDWSYFSRPVLDLQPAVTDLLTLGLTCFSLITYFDVAEGSVGWQGSPPVLCPRIYLSLLTTLLI